MLTARARHPLSRSRRPRDARDLARLISALHHERGVIARPSDDLSRLINSSSEVEAVYLMAGIYTLYDTFHLDVAGVHVYGFGHAVFERVTAFSGAMIELAADETLLAGVALDDGAGTGHAIYVLGDDCSVDRVFVRTGPGGGVALGDGIHAGAGADRVSVTNCRVWPSVPARPGAEIWFADTALNGVALGNFCPSGVISALAASGFVHAGNQATVTLR